MRAWGLPKLFCRAGVQMDATLDPQNGGSATNCRDGVWLSLLFIAEDSHACTATDPKSAFVAALPC